MSNWIGNLPLRFKFLLLCGIASIMAGVPTAMAVHAAVSSLLNLQSERGGMTPVRQSLGLIKVMQEHRGLAASFLSGDASKLENLRERAGQVASALTRTRDAVASLGNPALDQTVQSLSQDWGALSTDVAGGLLTVPVSVKRHTELIARTLTLLEDISSVSGLALDPDAESYFLIMATARDLPRQTEKLGLARALGASMLIKRASTPENRLNLSNLFAAAQTHAQDGQRNMARALGLGQESALTANERRATEQARQAMARGAELVASLSASESLPDMSGSDYFKAMTDVIAAQFALSEANLQRLDECFDAREAALRRDLLITVGTTLLMLGLGAWVAITVTRTTTRAVADAVRVAEALARGDLSCGLRSQSRDEIGTMVSAMGQAIAQLQSTILGIKSASDAVAIASNQIAQGNQDLSARTESQASALQQTASSMEEMSATVNQNASTAQQAHQIASSASTDAAQGGEAFAKMMAKMGEIKQTSARIADINAVIDGIAFQTNILALNAAVEAARAGEQGRGFSVVASEVRLLAQRSASAAKEVKSLISSSVESVEEGYELANHSSQSIASLVHQVQRVSDLMAEIASANEQQSLGISQVNQAVTQLDQSTQLNAALVEQSTAAASSLSKQAGQLQEAVWRFKLA